MSAGISARLLLAIALIAAQTPERVQPVVVSVRDAAGRPAHDLRAADFIVQEAGVERAITSFREGSDSPLSLGILVDTSDSMRRTETPVGGLRTAIGAARLLLAQARPQDAVQLMSFDRDFSVDEKFTGDKAKIAVALERLKAGGITALVRGLEGAVREMRAGPHRRKALIVIGDVFTFEAPELMARFLAESEVPVYVLVVRTARRQILEDRVAPSVVDAAGGRWSTLDVESDGALERLNRYWTDTLGEVRGQYTLTYAPAQRDGALRLPLRVRTRNPGYRVIVDAP
jgi:VWFA-related protein